MDCNKDEALRAKEVAEKKMLNNDFEGAKKVAVKAERLYPQLENISQLLAVCNVHCSSRNNKVGSERDWYAILQIDRLSDEATIKKQYRRLALMLHPDKNKLPGAEAAFKLIVEANMVLSDQVKRSLYDTKYRVISGAGVAKQPPHLVNRNSFVKQNSSQNGFNAQFSNLNHHKYTQPTSSAMLETFWTQCHSCKIRYQYYNNYVNCTLRCQKCSKTFVAYDLGSQGVPCGPKSSQPGGKDAPLKYNLNQPSEQKEIPSQGTSKMNAGSAGFPPTQTGYQQGFSSRTAGSEPEKCRGKTAPVFENIRSKQKDEKHEKPNGGMREGPVRPKVDRQSRKRSRKQTVESSESYDTSTSVETEDVDIENGNDPPRGQGNGIDGYGARRSSRRRQNVSYSEGVSDDENDLASPLKKAQSNQSAGDSKPQQKEAVGDDQNQADVTRLCSNSVERLNQNGVRLPEGDVQNNNSKIGTVKYQVSRPLFGGAKEVELIVDSDSEPDTVPDSNLPEVYDYPDPEFSDFDKHKAQNCFAIDQIWACYDTVDGMPRFYAHIRKVYSPEFKVMFSWLEAHPEDQRSRAWVGEELPVGCGKFKRGSTDFTSDRLTFSHQVQCEMGKRGLYIVYPRKGETWALFKDWDISWSCEPDNHRKYKYEIVEILFDYVVDVGVQVSYLDKVTRFVSLFQRTRLTEVGTFFVKPNELYKFSHRIPSFQMTGTEREGLPAGSFELDPASLPLNPDDIWYPSKVVEDIRAANSETLENVPPAVPPGTRDKSRMSENVTISLKSGELKGIHAANGESAKVRRSPRGVNISEEKQSKMSSRSANDITSTDFDDNCVKRDCHSSPSIPSHLSCQAVEELHSCTKSFYLSNSSGSSKNPITLSDDKGFEEVFCDFRMDISMGKFEVDQVWALYCQNSTLPRTYAQIKRIVPAPFKLHVVLLEVCAGPKNAQSVCGMFKVQNEKRHVYAPCSFSHVVNAVSIIENRFEIYPRGGDIWALYKNWKKSDLHPDKFEYEIVEVIENSKDWIKVSSLVRVIGFKSVFRSPSNPSILEIHKDEFGRFSHQIPAFQLTGEKGGVLRGCWELNPASVPCSQ